ncbi:MAG: LCP family protein [Chthonomonadales bacterium]|nr:LCP family protein [Chthonomonadales bacterium]
MRMLLIVLVCGVFGTAGTVFGLFYFGSETGRNAINRYLFSNPATAYTVERQFPGVRTLNVLVLGVDRDLDRYRRVMKTNGRSDSILIARVDFANKTIKALTIPRDTAVRIPGRRGIHKINAAHSFGGPDLTIETIQTVFGIPTDAYVTINFDGFCKVVDAIGGVDLTVEKRLKYDDNWGGLHINLYPGFQHLNGYQAMGYVRMRHSDSDEMRSKRQHNFLEAVRTKLKNPLTWPKLPGAIDQLADSLKRSPNLTVDQMLALANFARSLEATNIEVQTLPSIEGRSYVTVKRSEAQDLIRRMFFYDQLRDVYIDTPDPDVVAQLNGEYRRRSRRSQSSSSSETQRTESSEAAEPTGDTIEAGPADGDTNDSPDGSMPGTGTSEPDSGGAQHGMPQDG